MSSYLLECGLPLSEHKSEDTFRVIDRRLFTEEGELRQEMVEEEKREAVKEASVAKPEVPAEPTATLETPPAETPKRSAAFENLHRMNGSNAAMILSAYTD